jgi:hypothetical protein
MTDSFLDHPVFICGHRRSGTTMLTSLLDHHPALAVYPTDSGFFYAVYPILMQPGRTAAERIDRVVDFCIKNLSDILEESFNSDELAAIAFPFERFRERFRELVAGTEASPRQLLVALIRAFHEQVGHPLQPRAWVEKTTSSEIYAMDAAGWFPHARFIHVLRDPRDNWASLKSGWETRFQFHNDSPSRLMQSMIERGRFGFQLADSNLSLLGPERYRVVRYEDLVSDTGAVMRDLCRFIGVDFVDEVTRPTMLGRPWRGNNYQKTAFAGASAQNRGRWRERITPDEASLLEYHFEPFMIARGYALESSAADRSRAAVEHYKWHNYAQNYSFVDTQATAVPLQRIE